MNVWSKGDDAAVCLSYLYHGVKATPELLAALSHLTTGSIRMRLQNVQYLATDGASGLSGVAAQTHEVWARVSALLDVGMTPTAMNYKASPGKSLLAPSRSLVVAHAYQIAKQGAWDELLAWWGAASVFAIVCSRYRNASSGWTFLHQAAYFGNEAAGRELIRWGAKVNAAAANGETPADIAQSRGHDGLADLLREASTGEDDLWEAPSDIDLLPSSNHWDEAVTCHAVAEMHVAYGGGIVAIPAGTRYFTDALGRTLVGWHGTYNPPMGMDAYSCIADELAPEAE
jgi:uncharacterized protein